MFMNRSQKVGRNDPCTCGSGKKFKKCCGHPSKRPAVRYDQVAPPEISARAYTDETGNSGNALFDSGQDYFWTGTLVCEPDLDQAAASAHAECLRVAEKAELHGNALGLGGIEKISDRLLQIFLEHNCSFYFTQLHKRHLAATKFFDTVFDSGLNKAVSNLHYGVRGLCISLAVQLIQLLDEVDRREFWEVYSNGDVDRFRAILTRVRDRLVDVHDEGIYHERTVQLLRDGLDWGVKYPEPLIEQRQSELDSPNIVAFSLLISMLHTLHEETGARVTQFVHDEQNQFGKFLRQSYGMLRRYNIDRTIAGTLLDFKMLPTFGCELSIARSSESVGLQLADVALWLIKRFVQMRGAIHGGSRRLAQAIIERGVISPFTLESMQQEVLDGFREMEARPVPEEKMKAAKAFVGELEERRLARMAEPPDRR
jgi:hypothetical protein